jgi:hypothetical protein
MPIDFPASPTTGDVYTYQGKSWVYNGTGWDSPRALSEIGAVQTFANAAARTAAIPTPTEGIVSYLNDVDSLSVYNGTEWVTNRPVMSFASTAARESAIPSPVAGMTTYLEDSKNLEIYDGSSYTSPSGMTLVAVANPSAVAFVNINGCFSAAYQNYRVYLNLNGPTAAEIRVRLRSAGTNATTGYTTQVLQAAGSSVFAVRDTTSQAWSIAAVRSAGRTFSPFDVSNPFVAAESAFMAPANDPASGATLDIRSGSHSTALSYDSLAFFLDAGTFTGTIRVYGLRN